MTAKSEEPTPTFEREDRYIVIKRKHLDEEVERQLLVWLNVAEVQQVPKAVVVEGDWPEYETVWKMIEDRVTGTLTKPDDEGLTLLRDIRHRVHMVEIVDQGAGGTLSFMEMVASAKSQAADIVCRIDTYLKGQSTNREEEIRADWQPIETAPKDGRRLLLHIDGSMHVAHWHGGWHLSGRRKLFAEPTHWQPAPEPPQAIRNGETK